MSVVNMIAEMRASNLNLSLESENHLFNNNYVTLPVRETLKLPMTT